MPLQKLFKHGCVSLTIDVHGTSEQPLFSIDQVATALWLEDVEARIISFESDEVTMCGNVPFLTELGVRRLSRDGQSSYSSAFGKWAVQVAKETLVAEKRALEQENQELMRSKRPAEECVYAIRNNADPRNDIIKIGTSRDLDARTGTLGTAMPDGVGRLFTMKCVDGKLCERLVHNLLKKYHYNKEWFKIALPTVILCIKAAVYVGDGLVRNLGRLTEENVDNMKVFFENLEPQTNNKRIRVRQVSPSRSVEEQPAEISDDPLERFLKECLVKAPEQIIHPHALRTEFAKYLQKTDPKPDVVESVVKFTQRLESKGFVISAEKKKKRGCCANPTRSLLGWRLAV